MRRLGSVLLWSVISAAFIGPGTVTTAASAGAEHGLLLLWALLFSTVACMVLQEAAARLSLVTGRDLAAAVRQRFSGTRGGWMAPLLAGVAIVVGCAAYEAGNILGGVAGASLAVPASRQLLTVGCGAVAASVLWVGSPRRVARWLSAAVAVMGVGFLVVAVLTAPPVGPLVSGLLVPRLPPDSGLLVLGLVGTTVVPYNLFLGSGITAGESIREMRFGLTVAIGLGGLISMGVLVAGSSVDAPFGFDELASVLASRLGGWAAHLFAFGLLAAGLSSAITAPLAAAVTVRGLMRGDDRSWDHRSWRYRVVWGGVLLVGLAFGLSEVRPVPAIIAAQALNGLVLPLAALFLLVVVNDRALMREAVNGAASNGLMAVVAAVTVLLGGIQVTRAVAGAVGADIPAESDLVLAAAIVTALLAWPAARWTRRARRASSPSSG